MRNAVVSLLAKFRALPAFRRRLFVVVAILVGLIVFARVSPPPRPGQALNKIAYENAAAQSSELQTEAGRTREELIDHGKLSAPPLDSSDIPASRMGGTMAPGDPLIAHTAELAVATNEFAKARSTLEEILDRHRGYVAKLRMVGKPAGSTLLATLRIPSSEYGSALGELKTLGQVEREEGGG